MIGFLITISILLSILFIVGGVLLLDSWDYEGLGVFLACIGVLGLVFFWAPATIYYGAYIAPTIEADLHSQCQQQGYDTLETWKGVGFFPTEASYVKCKYYENVRNYQGELDLNINRE